MPANDGIGLGMLTKWWDWACQQSNGKGSEGMWQDAAVLA